MINLLPQKEKKEFQSEYWLRFGIVISAGVLVLEALSTVLFTPAFYALYTSTSDVAQSLAERRALIPVGTVEAEQGLAMIRGEMALLAPGTTIIDIPPSSLLESVIAQKPMGIELNTLSYGRGANTVTLQLSGDALTQEDLLHFRRNVKTDPRVVDFKYGSSFITQKTDINFSATITLQ
jgi:hypothetical protein